MGWSLNMLKNAGYIEAPSSGSWKLTSKGRSLLEAHPTGFDDSIIRGIVAQSKGPGERPDTEVEPEPAGAQQTPEERIDSATAELNAGVATELLQRISQSPPVFFEQLVLDLLHSIGYGQSESDLEHVGRTGDGGIDGIISLDKLGLEKIHVQAKRWQGPVGRPEIQGFYGALAGRRAKKGIFVTTSTFTREAKEYGEQVSDAVVLVDGARLAALMIEYGVGVSHYREIKLSRVDSDYFAEA